jgi:hypothetical protein
MIRKETTGINGKKIIEMIPETKEDERLLQRMIDDGTLELWDGFSEFPEDKTEVIE